MAVKSASINGVAVPLAELIVNESNEAPTIIASKKLINIVCVVDNDTRGFFLCFDTCLPFHSILTENTIAYTMPIIVSHSSCNPTNLPASDPALHTISSSINTLS